VCPAGDDDNDHRDDDRHKGRDHPEDDWCDD
jgi:hypothetical protein